MITGVFFDVDDTLVDYAPTARSAFHDALGPDADYDGWLASSHFERFDRGEVDFVTMRHQRMADYLRRAGSDADPVELEAQRFRALEQYFALFDDVLPCLGDLRAAGLRLGLITNNDGVHQRRKLGIVGLLDAFDAVTISGDIGVGKPDPRIFAAGCTALDVRADEAVHVGDRLDYDALGARDAGLGGIWLDRQRTGVVVPPGIQMIASLAELPPLLMRPADRAVG